MAEPRTILGADGAAGGGGGGASADTGFAGSSGLGAKGVPVLPVRGSVSFFPGGGAETAGGGRGLGGLGLAFFLGDLELRAEFGGRGFFGGAALAPCLERVDELVEFGADVADEDEDEAERVGRAEEHDGAEDAERVLENVLIDRVAHQAAEAFGEILGFAEALDHRRERRRGDEAGDHREHACRGELFGAAEPQIGHPKKKRRQ